MNLHIVCGKMARDPEVKEVGGGHKVCKFSVVTNDWNGKENVGTFHSVQTWNAAAEFVSEHFKKGSNVEVVGVVQENKWTDKDGNNRSMRYINPVPNGVKFGPKSATAGGASKWGDDTGGGDTGNNDAGSDPDEDD